MKSLSLKILLLLFISLVSRFGMSSSHLIKRGLSSLRISSVQKYLEQFRIQGSQRLLDFADSSKCSDDFRVALQSVQHDEGYRPGNEEVKGFYFRQLTASVSQKDSSAPEEFIAAFYPKMSSDGKTALHHACFLGMEEYLKRALLDFGLLEKKDGLEAKDKNGKTALYYAVINGHHACVKEMLGSGAEVTLDMLYNAEASGSSEVRSLLFQALVL